MHLLMIIIINAYIMHYVHMVFNVSISTNNTNKLEFLKGKKK